MRRTLAAIAIVALGLLPRTAVPATEPFVINGIVSLTGPNAFSGQGEAKTLGLIETVVNRQGGIKGRPIKIVLTDDESNPQIAVQLVSRLAATNAAFFFGPGFTATCLAALPVVAKNGPLMLCGTPGLVAPPGSYGIAAGPTLDDAMLVMVRYFRERGWTRLGIIASTDGSGQAYSHGIQYALSFPENKDVQVVAFEHMNPTDISVAGPLERIKSAKPQALLTLASGTPWGTIMRGVNDAGIDLPIGAGNGNLVYSQLAQYKSFLPREVYFPGLISLVPGSVGNGPIKDAQAPYFAAFREVGIAPDLGYIIPWDTAMIVMSALRALGTDATAKQLHDYFMNLHGWAGINGIYDFRDGSQRGIGMRSLVMDRYDNAKGIFIPASRPGGYLK